MDRAESVKCACAIDAAIKDVSWDLRLICILFLSMITMVAIVPYSTAGSGDAMSWLPFAPLSLLFVSSDWGYRIILTVTGMANEIGSIKRKMTAISTRKESLEEQINARDIISLDNALTTVTVFSFVVGMISMSYAAWHVITTLRFAGWGAYPAGADYFDLPNNVLMGLSVGAVLSLRYTINCSLNSSKADGYTRRFLEREGCY